MYDFCSKTMGDDSQGNQNRISHVEFAAIESRLKELVLSEKENIEAQVKTMKKKVADVKEEYNKTIKKEKQPLDAWKSSLELFKTLPVKEAEEEIIEKGIQIAEELESEIENLLLSLKPKKKLSTD